MGEERKGGAQHLAIIHTHLLEKTEKIYAGGYRERKARPKWVRYIC